MRANSAKAAIAGGGRVLNAWCSIASQHIAEALAHQGFDAVTIDLQHGAIDYAAAFAMLQAISTSAATPLARPPWNEPGILMKLLDSGAYGIICPMISTRRDAEAFVGACRYPPLGFRSFGPNRVAFYAGTDYWRHANAEVMLLAQIETAEAAANLDDILSVPGLDGIYVGPADLSLSMGAAPSMRPVEPEIVAAMAHSREAAHARGLIAAIHTDGPETALARYAEGYQLCSLQTDMRFLVNAARAAVVQVKGGEPS